MPIIFVMQGKCLFQNIFSSEEASSYEYKQPIFSLKNSKNSTFDHTLTDVSKIYNKRTILFSLKLVNNSKCYTAIRGVILPAKSRSDVMFCLQSYGTYLS